MISSSETKIGKLQVKTQKDIVNIENHRYLITFSSETGNVIELFDKKLNTVLLKQQEDKSIFSYQYDRYGIEDITTYLKDYAYRFSTWGVQDYGREAYPECNHTTFCPTFQSYTLQNDTLTLNYTNALSVERYGDAEQVQIEITLPPAGEELYVSVKLTNKQETPYVESGSFLFPFAKGENNYRINKPNAVLNPATDIQEDANHMFYSLENYMSVSNQEGGLCIIGRDTPLVSLGNTGVYKYRKNYQKPEEPIAFFNLFNNMWGTNFPQWIGGDFEYRFILFGYEADQESNIMERAAQLVEGVELTHHQLEKEFGCFPEQMQLINARQTNNGLVIRLKHLSGTECQRTLCLKGQTITPVDLHNRIIGEVSDEEYKFLAKPYGIHSFLLTRI